MACFGYLSASLSFVCYRVPLLLNLFSMLLPVIPWNEEENAVKNIFPNFEDKSNTWRVWHALDYAIKRLSKRSLEENWHAFAYLTTSSRCLICCFMASSTTFPTSLSHHIFVIISFSNFVYSKTSPIRSLGSTFPGSLKYESSVGSLEIWNL